ncbi:hypothetical protein DNTS_012147 [Danionella cerebrum]|uniref:Uncharacterized protein n=1 Tax=Danionella cerebrum TaxID=2873325 RepID=A0A553Q8W9_9TELE|nr:hypothetical protein DNTS_012147 [Danionella translucida]
MPQPFDCYLTVLCKDIKHRTRAEGHQIWVSTTPTWAGSSEVDLPYEVRRYYHPQDKLSNMDRVIVALNQNKNKIEDIYISEHYHLLRTFRIGASLIDDLRWDQNLTTV